MNSDILGEFKNNYPYEWTGAVEYKELYNFWIRCKSNAITESSNPENSYQSENDNFEIENYESANTSEAVVNVTTISQMELDEIAMGGFDVINNSNCTVIVDDQSGFAGVTQNISSDELDNSVIVIDKVRMDGKDFNTDITASESFTVNKIAIDKPEENHNEIRSFVIDTGSVRSDSSDIILNHDSLDHDSTNNNSNFEKVIYVKLNRQKISVLKRPFKIKLSFR